LILAWPYDAVAEKSVTASAPAVIPFRNIRLISSPKNKKPCPGKMHSPDQDIIVRCFNCLC
jgi:hypothetical protein